MINKIEHIGIAVTDLKKSEDLFEKLLGKKPYKKEEVASEGVVTSFFKIGNQKIELLKGNNVIAETAFRWLGASWLQLSLCITKTKESEWAITGKVWEDGKKEPTKPTISHKETKEPRKGRPSIWGSPYSGTPIRYDDISINKKVN